MMLNELLRPERPADVDGFVDPRSTGVKVEFHGFPLLAEPARTNPEGDASICHQVGRGHGPRRDKGVAKPNVENVGSQPNLSLFSRRVSPAPRMGRTRAVRGRPSRGHPPARSLSPGERSHAPPSRATQIRASSAFWARSIQSLGLHRCRSTPNFIEHSLLVLCGPAHTRATSRGARYPGPRPSRRDRRDPIRPSCSNRTCSGST